MKHFALRKGSTGHAEGAPLNVVDMLERAGEAASELGTSLGRRQCALSGRAGLLCQPDSE